MKSDVPASHAQPVYVAAPTQPVYVMASPTHQTPLLKQNKKTQKVHNKFAYITMVVLFIAVCLQIGALGWDTYGEIKMKIFTEKGKIDLGWKKMTIIADEGEVSVSYKSMKEILRYVDDLIFAGKFIFGGLITSLLLNVIATALILLHQKNLAVIVVSLAIASGVTAICVWRFQGEKSVNNFMKEFRTEGPVEGPGVSWLKQEVSALHGRQKFDYPNNEGSYDWSDWTFDHPVHHPVDHPKRTFKTSMFVKSTILGAVANILMFCTSITYACAA